MEWSAFVSWAPFVAKSLKEALRKSGRSFLGVEDLDAKQEGLKGRVEKVEERVDDLENQLEALLKWEGVIEFHGRKFGKLKTERIEKIKAAVKSNAHDAGELLQQIQEMNNTLDQVLEAVREVRDKVNKATWPAELEERQQAVLHRLSEFSQNIKGKRKSLSAIEKQITEAAA